MLDHYMLSTKLGPSMAWLSLAWLRQRHTSFIQPNSCCSTACKLPAHLNPGYCCSSWPITPSSCSNRYTRNTWRHYNMAHRHFWQNMGPSAACCASGAHIHIHSHRYVPTSVVQLRTPVVSANDTVCCVHTSRPGIYFVGDAVRG